MKKFPLRVQTLFGPGSGNYANLDSYPQILASKFSSTHSSQCEKKIKTEIWIFIPASIFLWTKFQKTFIFSHQSIPTKVLNVFWGQNQETANFLSYKFWRSFEIRIFVAGTRWAERPYTLRVSPNHRIFFYRMLTKLRTACSSGCSYSWPFFWPSAY
jgi:hypothetical protein